jgi:MarR-like DNA-binding transcriptional regulator SgrR of sgrS sRNA
MQDLYRSGDKQAFTSNPYWALEFVGLGPYRIGRWVQGSFMEALAFDDYFLGRPKIDRLIIRYFTDATIIATNLLSGDLDLVAMGSLKSEDLIPVRSAWEASQGGTILEIDGFQVATALDEPLLREIASRTDGKYFAAADQQALAAVYDSIDLTWTVANEHIELTALFAGAAALLVLVGVGLSFLWFGRAV